eukprot:6166219-Alexandrium_andersonii.AAC.1
MAAPPHRASCRREPLRARGRPGARTSVAAGVSAPHVPHSPPSLEALTLAERPTQHGAWGSGRG